MNIQNEKTHAVVTEEYLIRDPQVTIMKSFENNEMYTYLKQHISLRTKR